MAKKFELLMPGGSLEKIKYAIAHGADAVYAGVPKYSLRARENEFFEIESIKEAINYVHSKGKKIYLTTNIYAHNNKINSFMEAMKQMVDCAPDAFIMTDPGLIMLTRELFPDVEIHLSTQANNTNWAQAKFWYEQGVTRVILARELKVKEIKEIHEKVPGLELEAFVHGSICMAYSGRCLLSNYLNYRDANQGTCSHTCRWGFNVNVNDVDEAKLADEKSLNYDPKDPSTYKNLEDDVLTNYVPISGEFFLEEKERPGEMMPVDEDEFGTYIMNSKDLCAVDYMQDLVDAGIISFKVEGRNKTEYYAGIVAKTYRKALDLLEEGKEIDKETRDWMLKELSSTANRGFIPGFYAQSPAAAAQEFEKDTAFQTHLYAGKIVGFDPETKFVEFEVKNRLDKGEKIEIITPNNVFEFELDEFYYHSAPPGESSKITEHAHGGGRNIFFKLSDDVIEELNKSVDYGKDHYDGPKPESKETKVWEVAVTRMLFKEPTSLKNRTPLKEAVA